VRTSPLAIAAILALASGPALAFFEPPVTGPRDAACRDEARAKVFSAPDPEGLGLYATGKRIYMACMAASEGRAVTTTASARAR